MMRIEWRLLFYLLTAWLFFIATNQAYSQSVLEKIKFLHLDVNDGLSNSNVTCMLQDAKGFLWIGTSDGLNKYDGYDFVIYRQVQDDTLGLLNNNINNIFEDSQGKLWVCTHNRGLYYYDEFKDRIVAVSQLSSNGEISSITEDQNKVLWVTGVLNQQAFVGNLNRITNKWEVHYLFRSNESVTGMFHDSKDDYWLTIMNSGLFKWNKSTNLMTEIYDEKLNKVFLSVVKDNEYNLWFGTRNGLSSFNTQSQKFTHYHSNPKDPKNALGVNIIRNIGIDEKYLWIGTENGGLSRMETKTGVFTHYTHNKYDPHSISDNSIWSVYIDHQKRVWVGTFSNGLNVYDKLNQKFGELNVPLANDIVNAIWKDRKNRLWIGTEGGLTMQQGDKVQHYTHQDGIKKSIPNNPVLSIFEDSKNRIWIGTWDGGVSLYNEENDNFINYLPDPNNASSLSNPNVYSIAEESKSSHILVSTYHGLNVLTDEKSGTFENHLDDVEKANNFLRTIYQDSHGILWAGSITALSRIDLANNIRVTYLFDEITGADTFVNCIYEADNETLWVGSNKGLHKIKENSIVQTFTTLDGLPNDVVNGLLSDHHGYLWVSTSNGFAKFDPKNNIFTNYTKSDGLISNTFKPNACFKGKDGQMYFGGQGVNIFHPDSIRSNPYLPSVFLTGFKVLNTKVEIGGADSILSQNITKINEISIKPEHTFFTIEYVGINLTASNKNQYAYKLEGFDQDWVYIGTQRFATFTNLDPGTYTFRVKAANNDGLWNEEGASLIIHVLPPWWKTWWAYSIWLVMLIAMIYVIIRFRTSYLRNQRKLLKEQVKLGLHEMELKNERILMQAEELNTFNDTLQNLNDSLEKTVQIRTEELTTKNKKLAEYAFINAHNLRVPVANIKGLIQLFEVDRSKEETLELLGILKGQSEKLDSVLYDIKYMLEQDELLDIDKNNSN